MGNHSSSNRKFLGTRAVRPGDLLWRNHVEQTLIYRPHLFSRIATAPIDPFQSVQHSGKNHTDTLDFSSHIRLGVVLGNPRAGFVGKKDIVWDVAHDEGKASMLMADS